MNVLSLFDGISVGYYSLEKAGFKIDNYWASEIDKYAIEISKKNFPNIQHIGDISEIDWEEFKKDKNIDIIMGGFPCFAAGTLVMTNLGLVPIEDIKVGDLVLTHNKRFRPVLKTGKKLSKDIHQISGGGIGRMLCTGSHPFYVRDVFAPHSEENRKSKRRAFGVPYWLECNKITNKTMISSTYATWKKAPYKNPLFWEFMGRYVANGNYKHYKIKNGYHNEVYIPSTIKKKDKLVELLEGLKEEFGHNCYIRARSKNRCNLTIHSKELCEFIINSTNERAEKKHVPYLLWGQDVEFKKAFLKGFLDVRGHYNKEANKWMLSSVSKRLIYEIKMLVLECFNAHSTIIFNDKPEKGAILGRAINQKKSWAMIFKIDKGVKVKAYNENNVAWTRLRKNEKIDTEIMVYNLEVEEDNSYTADTITVHNCTSLSTAGKQKGLAGESGLLVYMLNAIETIKPKYVFFENVKFPKKFYSVICHLIGGKPTLINGALVSAQQRQRYYWFGVLNEETQKYDFKVIPQPEDRKILLKDILETGLTNLDKSYCLDASYYKGASLEQFLKKHRRTLAFNYSSSGRGDGIVESRTSEADKCMTLTATGATSRSHTGVITPVRNFHLNNGGQGDRVYDVNGKSVCLAANGGGRGSKTGPYFIDLPDGQYTIRKLTPVECERAMTLPDNYTQGEINGKGISNSQRYKMLGNSWIAEVIIHIFKEMLNEKQ